ncbi:MAG: CRISPR-associated protein Cas4 [Anaerolineales bacterium]
MNSIDIGSFPFKVTDLKQWAYCPRILFYNHCLPNVRPVTYKMEAGIEAGRAEEGREERRSLRSYGLAAGEREFNVPLSSARLGLRGEVDMVVTTPEGEIIPVDYKLSKIAGAHFHLQLAAYALMLEEMRGEQVRRGFLYFIPLRRAEEVIIGPRLRQELVEALAEMRAILATEKMPLPTRQIRKCLTCEFRRFCNDVL